MFRRWDSRARDKTVLTEQALRAALIGDAAYTAALDRLHPGVAQGSEPGAAEVRRQSTAFLSKAARRIAFLHHPANTVADKAAAGRGGGANSDMEFPAISGLLSWARQQEAASGATEANKTRELWNLERQESESMHPMTLQFGRSLADRFTRSEALLLWHVFQPVDEALAASFLESARECEGCGRNDGSYNSRMPPELLFLLRFPCASSRL